MLLVREERGCFGSVVVLDTINFWRGRRGLLRECGRSLGCVLVKNQSKYVTGMNGLLTCCLSLDGHIDWKEEG